MTADYSQMSFWVDSILEGSYTYNHSIPGTGSNIPIYHYNQTLFSMQGLTNNPHVMTVVANNNGSQNNVILFDYAIYT